MVDIHTGMNINEADFNRVVELLVLAMEDAGVSYREQNLVLAKLAPLRGEVIKR
jgi:hemoglobin